MRDPGDQLSRILTEARSIVRANFIEQASLVMSRESAPQPLQRYADMGFLANMNKLPFKLTTPSIPLVTSKDPFDTDVSTGIEEGRKKNDGPGSSTRMQPPSPQQVLTPHDPHHIRRMHESATSWQR